MNNRHPIISAIIISYNGMKFLPDCLKTLVDDIKDIDSEIIIVDNNSSDETVEFVKSDYPDIRLIQLSKNFGYAGGVNRGFKEASGEYLYILNQDLRFHEGCAKALLDRIKEDQSIGLIGPRYNNFDSKLSKSARSFPRIRHVFYTLFLLDRLFPEIKDFGSWKMESFDHLTERFVDQPMGSVILMPRKVVNEIGPMDEKFWLFMNDVDYCRRLAAAGYKRLYFPKAVVEHFIGGATSGNPYKRVRISHVAMYNYFVKYTPKKSRPIVWGIGVILFFGAVVRMLRKFILRNIISTKKYS